MNFIQKIVQSFTAKSTSSETQRHPLTNTSYVVNSLSTTDYLKLYISRQYACVSTIANSIAWIERSLVKTIGSETQVNHPYRELITYELLQKIVSHIQLTGSSFVYIERIGNKVQWLQVLRPDNVMIEQDWMWYTKHYRYSWDRKQMIIQTVDMMHFRLFNPLETRPEEEKWVSPMQAVWIQSELDRQANYWNWKFFQNWASVRDILTTPQSVPTEAKKEALAQWKDNFQWTNNAHKVAILDNWLQYQSVAPSQKEMDFVETRRFTRDEILAIYKVPKAIIGITDDVNRATAQVAQSIFAEVCLQPLCKLIEDQLNKKVFQWIGIFEFVDYITDDIEQVMNDYKIGTITVNEYREQRGRAPIEWGNVLLTSEPANQTMTDPKETEEEKMIKHIIRKNTKGTEEWKTAREEQGQKLREAKIKRTNNYEIKYIDAIKSVWKEQEKDIVQQLTKGLKMNKKWNSTKYIALRLASVWQPQKELIQNEANEALMQVWIQTMFQIGTDTLDKRMRQNIRKFAKSVDMTTKEKMFNIIDAWNNAGLSATEIAKNISQQFQEFSTSRAMTIARTEVTRASNEATVFAWEESRVVQGKEWYTALDERVCASCNAMHWKTIGLRGTFVKQGETISYPSWNSITYDYESIEHPPLHANCRCTLLPIVL